MLSDYKNINLIGEGEHGTVFLTKNVHDPNHFFAMKKIPKNTNKFDV